MDDFQPPNEYILRAISERNDNLQLPLIALYLQYVTQDLGNDILGNTPERIPDVVKFMKELAEKKGLPNEIINLVHDFSDSPTMNSRKTLLDALDQYIEPFDEDDVVRNTYLRLKYPDRPISHESE